LVFVRGVEGCEALLLHAAAGSFPRLTVVELQFKTEFVLRAPNLEVESGLKIGLGYSKAISDLPSLNPAFHAAKKLTFVHFGPSMC
jgi:hypothetical protein